MLKFFAAIFLTIPPASFSLANAQSPEDCKNPRPLFGKIVAVCETQMLVFVGDQKIKILGVNVTNSRFELANCSGTSRKPVHLETNSEGFQFSYSDNYRPQKYTLSRMWRDFNLNGIDYDGEKLNESCRLYDDKRTDIEYLP